MVIAAPAARKQACALTRVLFLRILTSWRSSSWQCKRSQPGHQAPCTAVGPNSTLFTTVSSQLCGRGPRTVGLQSTFTCVHERPPHHRARPPAAARGAAPGHRPTQRRRRCLPVLPAGWQTPPPRTAESSAHTCTAIRDTVLDAWLAGSAMGQHVASAVEDQGLFVLGCPET